MAKLRLPIPDILGADVLFAFDNTCCVCREPGKAVQIHHIDENPNNNVSENLSVLCLECHNLTQIKGGFGRKMNADLVIKYRDEWLERVKNRRDIADKIAVSRMVPDDISFSEVEKESRPCIQLSDIKNPPLIYINSLPDFRAAIHKELQPQWDTGCTATVIEANYEYIEILTSILVNLANYYNSVQFEGQTPRGYFSNIISAHYRWHRTIAEPLGPGTGGTIVNVQVSGGVVSDVEKMVEDMVMAVTGYNEDFEWEKWPKRWRGEVI